MVDIDITDNMLTQDLTDAELDAGLLDYDNIISLKKKDISDIPLKAISDIKIDDDMKEGIEINERDRIIHEVKEIYTAMKCDLDRERK